jgi:hypothetical protein
MPYKDKNKRKEYMHKYRAKHPKTLYFTVTEHNIEIGGEKYTVIAKSKLPNILADALYFAGVAIKQKKDEVGQK